jgi:hypothetical protein
MMTTRQMTKVAEKGMKSYLQFLGAFNMICGGKEFEKMSEEEQTLVEKKVELYAKLPKQPTLAEKMLRFSTSILFLMATLFGSVWFLIALLKLVGVGQ